MAKGKPVVAWGLKNPRNMLMKWGISYSRRETIRQIEENYLGIENWKQLYRRGWRVVKVRVEEIG
jgi:hypothetical protein